MKQHARVLSTLPDFALAGTALLAWIAPGILPERTIAWILMLMLLEFIVIHSNGVLGMVIFSNWAAHRRVLVLVGGGLFYTIFAGAFAAAMKTWWPLVSFWMLMANRIIHTLTVHQTTENERKRIGAGWAAAVLFYLVACFVTILVPLPRLGITPEVVAAQHFKGSGLWIEKPWTVVVMCALYFAAMGMWELRWADKMVGRIEPGNTGRPSAKSV